MQVDKLNAACLFTKVTMNRWTTKFKLDLKHSLLLIGLFSGHVANAAGPSQPITTQPVPNPPTSVLVCPDTCAKSLANAKDYKTNFGPMPTGQYQVNGLVPGKYEAGAKGFSMKIYSVGKSGVLDGQLGAPIRIVEPLAPKPSNSTEKKWVNAKGDAYPSKHLCIAAGIPPCAME